MTLIKVDRHLLDKEASGIIKFYRENPVVAAHQLLRVDGEPLDLAPIQQVILNEWWAGTFSILTASRGMGKSIKNGTKVLTSNGWIRVEDLQVGNLVVTPSGNLSQVTGVFPQGKLPTFKIKFSDERSSICSEDHLWKVRLHADGKFIDDVLDLKEINRLFHKKSVKNKKIRIPLVTDSFIKKEETDLPIHPYILGALIGDGYLGDTIRLASTDDFIVNKFKEILGDKFVLVKGCKSQWNIKHKVYIGFNELKYKFEQIGLLHKRAWEKFIPEDYMNLNREQTIELLQGLFDTDGCAGKDGRLIFFSTSHTLIKQVQNLVWKLGAVAYIKKYVSTNKKWKDSYRLYVSYRSNKELFSLPRKKARCKEAKRYCGTLGLAIRSIEKYKKLECTCIKIEDPEGLFIIDDYIVTHNTFVSAVYTALQTLLYPSTRLGIFAPAFRQSKFIFKEFERLHENSPVLNSSVSKVPTYGNDQCTCTFKPISHGIKPSEVVALPVGSDGGKIRGSRFRKIILDEIPHLPEVIFRSAIQPMMATAVNPMKRVKEVELLKRLSPNTDIVSSDNGYIGITSGYYQFNYWWQEIIRFYEEMKKGSNLYSVRFVPYYELPEGFYDSAILKDAEIHSPKHLFLTEWLAEWIADSEGAFPMSLLEAVRDKRVIPKYCKDPDLDKGKEFVFGIDVARESDSSAIVVGELGYPSKIVHIEELENKEFPDQVKIIFDLVERFKPIRIYIDEYGGGNVIRDQLAKPEQVGMAKSQKIILVENATKDTGKPILQLCNFNSAFIEDINNNAKTLIEQRAILFPDSTNPIEVTKHGIKGTKVVDLVQEMINQISSVVVTGTSTGRLHYDLPKRKGSVSNPTTTKKDLYTAFLLACRGIYEYQWKPKTERVMSDRGVIKERVPSANLTNNEIDGMLLNRQASTISNNNGNNRTIIKGGGVILRKNGRRK